jgi:DNA-binding LacI/PurR family transcriptional regulator
MDDDPPSAPSSTPKRRVTSADVALASGVSRATVSYVLNDTPNRMISDATRRLVWSTAERLGHVPNAPARALRSGRSNIVVALVPGFTLGAITDAILEALDHALTDRQMALLVHRHAGDERPLAHLLSLVLPTLVVSIGGLSSPDVSSIKNSTAKLIDTRRVLPNQTIGRMQVAYLAERGHRKLGFAFPADPALHPIAWERLAGVRAESSARGLSDPIVSTIDLVGTDIAKAMQEWLTARVTAVCAHNDALGMIVLSELKARGLGREDLAVIGVDNSPVAQYWLTTIAIDVEQLAGRVVEAVVGLLEDRPAVESDGTSLLELIVRSSA